MKEPLNALRQLVVTAADDKQAIDLVTLDLRGRSDMTDFFVICSGNSRSQVQAIADSIQEKTYGTEYKISAIEGYSTGNWVILDLGDIFVHVFHKDARTHFDLERLWGDVPIEETVEPSTH
jgi:ribosome-associated protein